nr:hypothetical protein [Tanacetum cinerariifolium]
MAIIKSYLGWRFKDFKDEAAHKELGDSLVRAATTASSLETEEHNGNINKTQSKVTPNESSSQGTDSGGGPRCQETMGDTTTQTRVESSRDEESLGKDASKQGKRIDIIDADKDIALVNDTDNEMFNMDDLGGEEVKEQVKAQVSKILPRIEQAVNEQLKAKVLTRSSHSSRASYAVAADLSEMELKKILIKKIEFNKSIQCSDEQRNLYKALDKDEEPSARPDRGLKRRKEGKEPESASTPSETTSKSVGRSTTGSRSRQALASESAFTKEPMQTTSQMEEPSHPESKTGADDQPIIQSSKHPKRRIIAITKLKIVEWHSYKNLDWITVRHDDDKLYKFKEGDFKRLRIQDIEDMLLLLVQGKLTNLTIKECFAFNASLRMFTTSIPLPLILDNRGRRVIPFAHFINNDLEYLRGGFIYQNKDKQNRLIWIDELHKFSDGTLTDVRTALDDRLKETRMPYLPQTIWRRSVKDRAVTMIQAIDKKLMTRRVIRSLERFKMTKLVDDMDNILFQTLKTMFEPHVEDIIRKYQQGAVKVNNWKFFDSYGVYCVTTKNMVYYLLVEKIYPFKNSILHELWSDVRLQVDYDMEMAYDLLRLIRRQINEGYKLE